MSAPTPEEAYPGIVFHPRSRGWLARFAGSPAECIHLLEDHSWSAMYIPDRAYLRGKSVEREGQRTPPRPDVSLCRACLFASFEPELRDYSGRVFAIEPPESACRQYFFTAAEDFDAAGLRPAVSQAIRDRLKKLTGAECADCSRPAKWIWIPRDQLTDLDEVEKIDSAPGKTFCASHGASALCRSLGSLREANILYLNLPYGTGGAYVWI